MRCEECKITYPSDYTAPLVITREGLKSTINVCGICALELTNKLHGLNRTEFGGEVAEEMRQRAVKWRATHNKDAVPSHGDKI